VAWGDYDNDGDLDLYIANTSANKLLRNEGGGVFVNATGGPLGDASVGEGVAWGDYDNDGDLDLYVANFNAANKLFRNDGGDTFVDATGGPLGDAGDGYGVAWGDYDNDGDLDLYVTNFNTANLLFRNDGGGTFVDETSAPLGDGNFGQGAAWGDYDNDGDLDLYFAGGRIKGGAPIPDALFRNEDGTFTEVTWEAGLADPASGKASALVDLDRDGFLELATANWAGPLRVYRNQRTDGAGENHWLVVDLIGTSSNHDALGATVRVLTLDGRAQTCFRNPNPSLGAGGELACHFGLGSNETIAELAIKWPDGTTQQVEPPTVDQRVTYVE
jgi:hypothetical protein